MTENTRLQNMGLIISFVRIIASIRCGIERKNVADILAVNYITFTLDLIPNLLETDWFALESLLLHFLQY